MRSLYTRRKGNGLLYVPAATQALPDQSVVSAEPSRPVLLRERFSTIRDWRTKALVFGLLDTCGPPTVLTRIRAVVVNAINRMSARWSRPHIGKEGLKGFPPFRRHGNTSAAVSLVIASIKVGASCLHFLPRAVLAGERSCLTMRSTTITSGLISEASARSDTTRPQVALTHARVASAITPTVPPLVAIAPVVRKAQYSEPCISFVNQIHVAILQRPGWMK